MQFLDRRTVSVLATIVVFIAGGAFIYAARQVLIVFLLAVFFAYLLEPLVYRTERWKSLSRGSRAIAILEVYVVLSLALSGVFFFAGRKIVAEGKTLADALPGLFENVSSGQIALQIGSTRGWSYDTQIGLQHYLADHRREILRWANASLGWVAASASNAIWVVLIPILAIFFLKDGSAFANYVVELVERKRRKKFLAGVMEDLNKMLAQYIRSQLILAGLALAAYMGFLSLLRVQYAAALGAVAGLLEFIPVVGPLIGAAVILGVSFLTNYHHLLAVTAFLAVWRIVQDYVTAPRLMGNTLELHPLAVIFAVLAGAEIAGVIGVYLSIPIAAAFRIGWTSWERFSASHQHDIKAA